jgi:hypothetical protein
MNSPPSNAKEMALGPSPRRSLITGIVAWLVIACSILMLVLLRPYTFECNFKDEVGSPVLELELGGKAASAEKVLQYGNAENEKCARAVLKTNNYLDLLFIPLYTTFLWLFLDLQAGRVGGLGNLVRVAGFGSVAVAAVFDYLEDCGIFRLLNASPPTDGLAATTSLFSAVKWGAISCALLLTAVALLRDGRAVYSVPTRRIQGLLYLAAGAFIADGLRIHSHIEVGMKVFGILVVWNAIGLVAPFLLYRFPGVHPVYVSNFCERRKADSGLRAVQPQDIPSQPSLE